jgi:hypothetical protein
LKIKVAEWGKPKKKYFDTNKWVRKQSQLSGIFKYQTPQSRAFYYYHEYPLDIFIFE